jgi:Glutamate racemase
MMSVHDKPVAVLAGTPVDTQMGADILSAHGFQPLNCPVSRFPLEQAAFQVKSQEEKRAVLTGILRGAMEQGCGSALIYCNSLSGSADFPSISRELGLRIVTPMDAYGQYASAYSRLAVIAYNGQALAGIDTAMVRANPRIVLLPAGVPTVTFDIEEGLAPDEIIRRNHIDALMRYFEDCGCEALVLGCTHFPYLTNALGKYTRLPMLDPAEEMLRLLQAP